MLEWLAKFAIFAKVANWLRTDCEMIAKFRLGCEMVAKIPALLFLLLLILSSTVSPFLHFVFVFPSIFGLVDECLKHSDYARVSLAFSCCFGVIYIVLGIRSLI